MSEEPNAMMGWASAVADGYRLHGCSTTLIDLMDSNGVTIKQLSDAGVEDYDLDVLKEVYNVR